MCALLLPKEWIKANVVLLYTRKVINMSVVGTKHGRALIRQMREQKENAMQEKLRSFVLEREEAE